MNIQRSGFAVPEPSIQLNQFCEGFLASTRPKLSNAGLTWQAQRARANKSVGFPIDTKSQLPSNAGLTWQAQGVRANKSVGFPIDTKSQLPSNAGLMWQAQGVRELGISPFRTISAIGSFTRMLKL